MTTPSETCARVRSLFSCAHDDEFAAGDREFFFAHLRACPACEREYAGYRKALLALRSLTPVAASRGFENRVLGRISEEAGRSTLLAMTTDPSPTQPVATRRGRVVPLRWAAAAAVLTGAVALVSGLALRPAPPAPPADPPPGMVRAGGRVLPEERFVEDALSARGFVRIAGRWMPAEEAKAFARGETWYRGRWRTQWELREALNADPLLAPPAPPPPDLAAAAPAPAAPGAQTAAAPGAAPSAEELLRALGYVRAGDRWLTPQEKEWIDRGYVLYRDRWLSPDDLRREVLLAEGFVFHDGRWMAREDRERLLASAPRQTGPATPRDALAAALRDLVVGEPDEEDLLAVYPLYARTTLPDEPWILLDAALRAGTVEIRDEKRSRHVKARNGGDRPLLILAGELLSGGHQDRVVAHDTLVPAGREWSDVAVYCAEAGRGSGKTDRFEAAPALAPPDLRSLVAVDAGQPALWSGIRRHLDALAIRSPTDSLCALYASGPVPERLRALERRLGDLPTRDVRTVGVAFGSGRGLIAAECFASNTLLRQAWPRVLAAAAAHAAVRRAAAPAGARVPSSRAGVSQILEQAVGGDWVPLAADPDGAFRMQFRTGDALLGEACLAGGRVGHATITVNEAPPAEAPAVYTLDAAKAQRLAAELARVMSADDEAARARAVREFGAVRWDRAAEVLGGFIATEPSDDVRIALADALGATRSPAAVRFLVDLLEKAPRRSPVARAAAQGLARTGAPRAVDPLVKLLHQSDAETARAGLEACVLLVAQLRDGPAIERAVSRLVAFSEGLDAHARETAAVAAVCPTHDLFLALDEPVRRALSAIAGVPFASGADARAWWNRNKDAYLRLRTR